MGTAATAASAPGPQLRSRCLRIIGDAVGGAAAAAIAARPSRFPGLRFAILAGAPHQPSPALWGHYEGDSAEQSERQSHERLSTRPGNVLDSVAPKSSRDQGVSRVVGEGDGTGNGRLGDAAIPSLHIMSNEDPVVPPASSETLMRSTFDERRAPAASDPSHAWQTCKPWTSCPNPARARLALGPCREFVASFVHAFASAWTINVSAPFLPPTLIVLALLDTC
eukprot:3172861-Pleurochrysis_carterae.AAC.1